MGAFIQFFLHKGKFNVLTINEQKSVKLKGKIARDFWPLVFFMNRPHMGPYSYPKTFRILVRILGDIRISKLFCGVSDPAEHKINFQIGGSLSMDPICLG